jgi:hypothetical protein
VCNELLLEEDRRVTYRDLLTALYEKYDQLLPLWDAQVAQMNNTGAFVFFPDSYLSAESLDQVKYDFWTIDRIQDYITKGGQTDDGLMELLDGIMIGEDFLVMIVEPDQNTKAYSVHLHKITQLGLN